ncbi:hypothetical protein EAO74_26235 [Streptomyces sp. gb1(2016)]|uniref:Uncharacterized protein n=1 Tax=Streptomyces sp. gb1(2016) TaxID=1828321 RepID=A0A652KK31_9ACTN|nr:hypothetical protein EAO74_26235 [Streptomyces sp. gb1(2016)]
MAGGGFCRLPNGTVVVALTLNGPAALRPPGGPDPRIRRIPAAPVSGARAPGRSAGPCARAGPPRTR